MYKYERQCIRRITLVYCRCDAKLYYDVLYIMLISPVQIILVTCNDNVQLIDTNGT